MKFAWPVLVLSLVLGVARAEEVEVIQLKYRTAEQMIPTLQPLVESGGGLSGMQNTLVIRSSRRNIEQLRQVIATLDRMPRKLLISVRNDISATSDRRGASVSGTIGGRDPRIDANVYDSRSARDERVASQVQALEGSPAYISTGQSVPVQGSVVSSTPYGSSLENTTTYQNISSGFYVTPRVSGDRVFLDISTQSAFPGRYGPGSANVQQIANTVSGRLGEWMPLGGIDQSAVRSQSGVLYGSSAARSATSSVWVKVDEIR
jgi:hypothetical protein